MRSSGGGRLTYLKARVERLGAALKQRADVPAMSSGEPLPSKPEEVLYWLRRTGRIRDPYPEEHILADLWESVPELEKEDHLRRVQTLEPCLSQVILQDRR